MNHRNFHSSEHNEKFLYCFVQKVTVHTNCSYFNNLNFLKPNSFIYWRLSLKSYKGPLYRSSHQRCSVKISALKNFTKFTGKHLCQSLLFNKRETLAQVFFCELCEIFKNTIFYRTPLVAETLPHVLHFEYSTVLCTVLFQNQQ